MACFLEGNVFVLLLLIMWVVYCTLHSLCDARGKGQNSITEDIVFTQRTLTPITALNPSCPEPFLSCVWCLVGLGMYVPFGQIISCH